MAEAEKFPRESAIFSGFWFLTNQASVSLMSGRLVIVSLSSNNYRLDQVDLTFGLCSRLDVRHMAAESPARSPIFHSHLSLALSWHILPFIDSVNNPVSLLRRYVKFVLLTCSCCCLLHITF